MSFRALRLIAYLVLGATVLMVFMPCVGNDFVNWDDFPFVVKNPHISTLSLKSLVWMVTTNYQGVWHPLTWLSHALDLALWGPVPSHHHLMNVLMHVITVLLVAALFVKLQEARGLPRESVYIAAFTGALLFGVHPLRVESVAWVAERKDVLCAMFTVASLVFYLDYAMASPQRCRRDRYLLSLLSFILALLSKPMAMTLPLILLIFDFFPLERFSKGSTRWLLVEKTPFFAAAAAAAALNMWAVAGSEVPFSYVPLSVRTMNAFHSVVLYIKQSIFPHNLVPLVQLDRELNYFSPRFVLSMVVVLGTTAACVWRLLQNDRLWAALWFSYLIGLAPVLGLFMSFRHAAADRYTYLPTLGLWLLVGLAVARVWQLSARLSRGAVPAKAGIIVVVAAIGSALAIHTHSQIGVWRNSETLWNYVLTRAEHVPALAFYATGKELEKKGDLDQAFTYYEIAQALDPPNPHYASELANVISKKGDRETALKMFKEILERYPDIVGHHRNVGRMYVLLERYDEAIPHLERALQMAPENGGSLFLLAFTYLKKGDVAQARSYYERYLSAGYSRREEIEPALGMDKDKDRGTGGVSR